MKFLEFFLALLLGPVVCIILSLILNHKISFNPPLSIKLLAIQLFMVAIPEEIFFRGIILEILREKIKTGIGKLSIANIITAFLFALAHLFYHPPLWALATFFPGLIFGYFKERTDSLIYPIILHFFYNFSFLTFFK